MRSFKGRIEILILIFAFIISCSGFSTANKLTSENVSAQLVAKYIVDEEEILLFDGLFRFKYPYEFQLQYLTDQSHVYISNYDDFMEARIGSEVEYGFDRHWIFSYFQDYIFQLIDIMEYPLEFVEVTQVSSRDVDRFVHKNNSHIYLYLDQQSGLPLLIHRNGKNLLSVSSYTILAGNKELEDLTLEISWGESTGSLQIVFDEQNWLPARLEVEQDDLTAIMEFSNWSFSSNWTIDASPRLSKLKDLNEEFFEKFDEQEWAETLKMTGEMLAIAPQFWQAYLYRAFIYEHLDNFLGVVENYQQVLMRHPNNDLALNNLAYTYFLREVQINQGLKMAEKAVDINRKSIYLDTLGYGYYLVGRYEEARELFLEALADPPEDGYEEIKYHLQLVLKALEQGE